MLWSNKKIPILDILEVVFIDYLFTKINELNGEEFYYNKDNSVVANQVNGDMDIECHPVLQDVKHTPQVYTNDDIYEGESKNLLENVLYDVIHCNVEYSLDLNI